MPSLLVPSELLVLAGPPCGSGASLPRALVIDIEAAVLLPLCFLEEAGFKDAVVSFASFEDCLDIESNLPRVLAYC